MNFYDNIRDFYHEVEDDRDYLSDVMFQRDQIDIILGQGIKLEARLTVPLLPKGLIIISHDRESGSWRENPCSYFIASSLWERHFATLMVNLLTEEELRKNSYDNENESVEILSKRLVLCSGWSQTQEGIKGLPIGYLGSKEGEAVIFQAENYLSRRIFALVCYGGHSHLSHHCVGQVTAPTLLIVGGLDRQGIGLNYQIFERLKVPKEMVLIEGVFKSFEESWTLDKISELMGDWYSNQLGDWPSPSLKILAYH